MGKRQILVNLDESLIAAIDGVAPERGRSEWISQACQDRLAGNGHTPDPDDDALVWRTACEGVLEAWRRECQECGGIRNVRQNRKAAPIAVAHGGNGNGNGGERVCEG